MIEWWQSLSWPNAIIFAVVITWVTLWALRRLFRPRRRPGLPTPEAICQREWYGDKK